MHICRYSIFYGHRLWNQTRFDFSQTTGNIFQNNLDWFIWNQQDPQLFSTLLEYVVHIQCLFSFLLVSLLYFPCTWNGLLGSSYSFYMFRMTNSRRTRNLVFRAYMMNWTLELKIVEIVGTHSTELFRNEALVRTSSKKHRRAGYLVIVWAAVRVFDHTFTYNSDIWC